VVVKLPLTKEGLIACDGLAREGIRVNVTLCFSAVQALLAAKAGASFISPFIGRLDDVGADGAELLAEIRAVYDNYDYETAILAASIRNTAHVRAAALAGSDCATIPPAVFGELFKHPLTEKGLDLFLADWAKTGQSIL
jgi:transaldolase